MGEIFIFIALYAHDSSTLLKVSYWIWLKCVLSRFMYEKPGSQCCNVG